MSRFISPVQAEYDNNGVPLDGAKLYFYASGSSTPEDTFSDTALTVPNAHPVIADAYGRFSGNIFLYPKSIYRVVLKDKDGVQIWDKDPLSSDLVDNWQASSPAVYLSPTSYRYENIDRRAELAVNQMVKMEGGADRYANILSFSFGIHTDVIVENVFDSSSVASTVNVSIVSASLGFISPELYSYRVGQVFSSKAQLELVQPLPGASYFVTSSDGGSFKSASGTAGTYTSNGGSACGTVIIPTGGDGSTAFIRSDYNEFNLHWFLTQAQLTDVLAYTYAIDVTTAVQNAMDVSFASNNNLYCPAGGHSVTGLTIPGTVTGTDDRSRGWTWYGQGTGEALAKNSPIGGTIFESTTNAPVAQDILDTDPSSGGSKMIRDIRFNGSSTTPALKLVSFAGNCTLQDCIIYQDSTGDMVELGTNFLSDVIRCFAFNKDYVTGGLGAARAGIGFKISMLNDGGLVTLDKCSCRGANEAIVIDGQGAAKSISAKIVNCQATTIYSGIRIENGNGAIIDNAYLEGGDSGTGILDKGGYTKILNSWVGGGFMVGIDASDTATARGTVIENNNVSLAATVNAVGIHVASSAAFGGYNKTVRKNSIIYTNGTAGVTGLLIEGTDPRISYLDNSFDPRSQWTGVGTLKIDDQSSGGVYGMAQGVSGSHEFPVLSKGGIILFDSVTLTGSDVAANVMTLPAGVSYFEATMAGAEVVASFDAGNIGARLIMIRSTNTNLTMNDGARLVLDGNVAFTGIGMITFIMRRIGGQTYAYEQSRTAL